MGGAHVPERGDVVWLEFNPQAGSEQAGRRSALVISPKSYNRKVGRALVCPITSRVKGYPFEVELPDGFEAKGAILCDQVKSNNFKPQWLHINRIMREGDYHGQLCDLWL